MFMNRRIVLVCAASLILITAVAAPFVYPIWSELRRADLAEACGAAKSERRWNELQRLADRWTAWEPENGEAWMYRGQAASGRQDWEQALASFWQVPDSDPQVVPALIEVSKLAFTRLNNPLKGAAACERILQIDPRAAGARQQLIGFYAATLQREKLLRQIQQGVETQSEPREAYAYAFLLYTLRSKEGIDLNERWLKSSPDEELFLVASILQLPDSKTDSQEIDLFARTEAEVRTSLGPAKRERVNQLRERFPKNLELLAFQAEERFDAGDIDGVTALLLQAPTTAKQDSRFWRMKGWVHESHNEWDDAVAAYGEGLRRHPVDWTTMIRLAAVERRRNNRTEVERLTQLVDRAQEIRRKLRNLTAAESVNPTALIELADFFQDCGDTHMSQGLNRRLGRK